MTALVDAVWDEDLERVVELLGAGANPSEPDEHGTLPLGAAIENGDLVCLRHLLAAGADPSGTALVYAAWASESNEAMLEQLLLAGADPNQPGESGSTALYMASVGGFAGKARVLLVGGADPNYDSPAPSDGTPLCAAACWDHLETVRVLLEHGADPDQAERSGDVPLEWAVRGLHQETVVALLEAGADANSASAPLVLAASVGAIGIVRALLEHGATPTQRDARGRTALAAAEAKVGVNIEAALIDSLHGEGPVEVHREPRAEASERIEVYRRDPGGGGHGTASETGHAQIVALLRDAPER